MNDSNRPYDEPSIDGGERRRQPRAIATQSAILRSFAIAFDSDGYEPTAMNDVINANAITKGAVYFHFPSKEAIAQQLIEDWNSVATQAFSDAASTNEPVPTQLRAAFTALADRIDVDCNIRAGMKLTLEPSIDGAHESHRRWIDATSNLIAEGVASGTISDTTASQRLAWNLCAAFTGAVHSIPIHRGALDLTTHTSDMLTSYLTNAIPDEQDHAALRRVRGQSPVRASSRLPSKLP